MLDELAKEIPKIATAFAMVAVPCLLFVLLAKSKTPRWKHRPVRFSGFEVIALLGLAFVLLPALVRSVSEATNLFRLWNLTDTADQSRIVLLLTAPLWLAAFFEWRFLMGSRIQSRENVSSIIYGCRGFLILTPIVLAIHFLAAAILILGGGTLEKHPLLLLRPDSLTDVVLLILSASVVAPIMEEMIFRGILLPWCRERVYRSVCVFVVAVVVLIQQRGVTFLPAMLLLIDLVAFMAVAVYGKQIWKKWPTRTASSVFATASLFAVMHAGVWPTPWPLLFLGIGLGMMASRSGSAIPSIITHSFFNTVSVIYLLRGGPP